MPNGKGAPDCHYCRHHEFGRQIDFAKLSRGGSIRLPRCTKFDVPLPLIDEQRICADYSARGEEGSVTSAEKFFAGLGSEPRAGVLYRYFYNAMYFHELMDLQS